MSGLELVHVVMERLGKDISQLPPASVPENYSNEYWAGWILAYYQWYSAKSFSEIMEMKSMDSIMRAYYLYHEMDITQFVDWIEGRS